MDIEPLWAIGGWSSLSNCMAEPKSSSPISEPFSKSPSFLHLLTLFFILLLLINLSHQPYPSTMVSSENTKAAESTMHPQNGHNSHSPSSKDASRREFGADAHEVPSGPNPISN
ncbi:unnamed protein product [Sphenostylis stenocarpa]|uniref:CLAVATA3/ESR (CLE)-related protein TDIF n=1 Tax=Sphenostylis stenocarpa TaxID=92480 RepID=A0AA86RT03_9FABA|nr:unnamed protein product [Sphenostylis stenocarpa]